MQLRGVTFEWLDPGSHGGGRRGDIGLIADEVEGVFPQWVGRDPQGYRTLTIGGFEALTAEALRDLRAEKDAQLERLERLQAEKDAQLERLQAEKDAQIADLTERLARVEALLARQADTRSGGAR